MPLTNLHLPSPAANCPNVLPRLQALHPSGAQPRQPGRCQQLSSPDGSAMNQLIRPATAAMHWPIGRQAAVHRHACHLLPAWPPWLFSLMLRFRCYFCRALFWRPSLNVKLQRQAGVHARCFAACQLAPFAAAALRLPGGLGFLRLPCLLYTLVACSFVFRLALMAYSCRQFCRPASGCTTGAG